VLDSSISRYIIDLEASVRYFLGGQARQFAVATNLVDIFSVSGAVAGLAITGSTVHRQPIKDTPTWRRASAGTTPWSVSVRLDPSLIQAWNKISDIRATEDHPTGLRRMARCAQGSAA
jgi:hypothetical protein